MKLFLFGVLACLGLSSAMAARAAAGESEALFFSCDFYSHHDKLARCEAEGRVLVKRHDDGQTLGDKQWLHVRCSDGKDDAGKAKAELDRDGDELTISSCDRDEDRLVIEEFKRYDGDKDNDDLFPARLHHDEDGDHDDWWRGRCRLHSK